MPFMKGIAPIRRTVNYLQSGKLVLKDRVQVFSVHYNRLGDHHKGAREFVFWNLPQVQYKNPHVQVVTFKNMTPSPFIRCYLEDGADVVIDIDGKTKEEIQDHLQRVICKSSELLAKEAIAQEKKDNEANFGYGCQRHCICEMPGQVPCPAVCPLPNHMRGKFKYAVE
ncbi:small ribosomal subunit protein mS25 [Neocloeon triangulifer]|uniref:small ribosomal subunit protein mS25 n=1 Tax=Neocloeon triangulifer TaxID=2078957 RepID=UPI00286F4E68|nr:small ribosomal subunit protein mS25 [Neocloeon triangulifer]